MHGLMTLVNSNHMDKFLKEILTFVYYGSIVNNQPKNNNHTFWLQKAPYQDL